MSMKRPLQTGRPWPMGVTLEGDGANIAVFSAHAEAIILCLFDAEGHETARHRLPERAGDIHFGFVPGVTPGTRYGLRAEGPWAPEVGHRFNAATLLLDPYAPALNGPLRWSDALMGHGPDGRDTAAFMPKGVVMPRAGTRPSTRPMIPWAETVIYEAHVKGLTMRMPGVRDAGTFAALGSAPVIAHLTKLGVTAIELLPVQSFITDAFLQKKGMTNYWGYQTLGFFAPHPPFLAGGGDDEIRGAVTALHQAGIEVLLDVVYNHTCEGDAHGPTLSFRGLDNASYYRLDDAGGYINDTGTGNTVNVGHPAVMRLIMDSLRHWVQAYDVDGFRFDLGATLGRGPEGFDARAPLFQALAQDPVLSTVKLIAEPWDIGPGGYQLGAFPQPFAEWNDRFRDTARRAMRGDPGQLPALAGALTGSADVFDHGHRPAQASVNFITAHDGFTLSDLVSFARRHNAANGEAGRDGHGENLSDNMGEEGPTQDTDRRAARALRQRNLLAVLMLSQGVPMLLSGDEIGNSQGGNNNAYAMDNETGWIAWADADEALSTFVARLIRLRRRHGVLRQSAFLHGRACADGTRDLIWRRTDGAEMNTADWEDPGLSHLVAEMRMAGTGGPACLLVVAMGLGPVDLHLPPGRWTCVLDTAAPDDDAVEAGAKKVTLHAPCVTLYVEDFDYG